MESTRDRMRKWTDEVDALAAEFFATLSDAEIGRRQELCCAQIGMAHNARNTEALEDLRRMEDALASEMMRRLARP